MIPRASKRAVWTACLVLAMAAVGGDTLGAGSVPAQAARPHAFNIYTWHVQNFPARWAYPIRNAFVSSFPSDRSIAAMSEYFEMTAVANGLEDSLKRIKDQEDRAQVASELAQVKGQRDGLRNTVERTIESMLSRELVQHGLTRRFLFLDVLWPPVYLRITDMPSILVVSPRDQIHIQETHLLAPDLSFAKVLALENAIDGNGLSGLVENLGGLATYPSLLPDTIPLRQLLEMAAHEWTHQHLYFRPLGSKYRDGGDMTVLNETVADLVGRELGQVAYQRHSELMDRGPSPAASGRSAAAPGRSFDFAAAMRETRETVDTFLAEGRVDEAEDYMDTQRQVLEYNGYFIRKLNQAYFAFHGNYAERPGSVNPIGGYVRSIRESSLTLGAFVNRVAAYSKMADLLRDLESLKR